MKGPISVSKEELQDRLKAFEVFRKSYRKYEAMQDNRVLLKQKMDKGRALGPELAKCRQQKNTVQAKLEQIRREYAMMGKVDAEGNILQDAELDRL